MYDDCVYHMKEENESLNPFIGKKKVNSANTEKLGQYESYWPSFSVLAEFFHIGRVCSRYDAGWFVHTDTLLMYLINNTLYRQRIGCKWHFHMSSG